jgi:hypothetical protein
LTCGAELWYYLTRAALGNCGMRQFQDHHRFFMAQLSTENGKVLQRIKSVADALPFADDYRRPWAEARAGQLREGDGFANGGFDLATGAYEIAANESGTAEIAFDAARGGALRDPLAYWQPAIVIANLRPGAGSIRVGLSQDNGATFYSLPESWVNLAPDSVPARIHGGSKETPLELLCPIPSSATGPSRWVLRISRADCD